MNSTGKKSRQIFTKVPRVGACAAAANARKNVEGMKLSDIFYLKTARDKKIVVTYMNFRTSKKEALTVLWRGRAGKPQVFSNRSCNADLLASMTHSEMRREVRVHHFQKDNRDFPEFKITLSNKSAPDE
ncbi:PREDICTED: uncharacterized protein LOC108566867 [Nicrophorus vespilloides]|uniref:Uncharacterized protein LOC108566867 n=1 Tax=Nicrophorus vespilloides TaxID=110193 RepID=A0ABM1N6K2_NICVS|nr:PREDICTED: uncharacterized protein LOC108566867 [Nicrophorus vespilloides]XP_017782449.1 PREDICTED: uncharacterized protein LOC108566867 [Nicrophorus vespilloides]XP_017782451.1 PREDICTED: uncharacterized protein LOC108566867 [Nicrophorus vespilloides]XP_017782452.1 PREDICTED: uncharacterized protein LOC108566867 [Nicrophorus vespilloides]